ncbi:MAG: FHA domain-containing protein [Phycisphaerae bacterium]
MTSNYEKTIICESCREPVPVGANFCPGCGNAPGGTRCSHGKQAPSQAANGTVDSTGEVEGVAVKGEAPAADGSKTPFPLCPGCGAVLQGDGRFCRSCGTPCEAKGRDTSPAGTVQQLVSVPPVDDPPGSDTGSQAGIASGKRGCFRIERKGSSPKTLLLSDGDEVTIGKDHFDIDVSDDAYVSRSHLKVMARDGRLFIRDLGSTNGSYLRVRQETDVESGDEIVVGRSVLKVSRE